MSCFFREFRKELSAYKLVRIPCAVCSHRVFKNKALKVLLSELPHADILVAPVEDHENGMHSLFIFAPISLSLLVQTRTQYAGKILDPVGIELEDQLDGTTLEQLTLCQPCFSSLQKRNRLKFALINNFDFETPFSHLLELTIAEECLVVWCRAHCYIFKLTSRSVGPPETMQRALKGHVICFLQNVTKIFEALPHSPIDLVDNIQVIFLGYNTFKAAVQEQLKKCKLLNVRCQVVFLWLQMLQQFHRMYKDVHINGRFVFFLSPLHLLFFPNFFQGFEHTTRRWCS